MDVRWWPLRLSGNLLAAQKEVAAASYKTNKDDRKAYAGFHRSTPEENRQGRLCLNLRKETNPRKWAWKQVLVGSLHL